MDNVYTKLETDELDAQNKESILSYIWSNPTNPDTGYLYSKHINPDGSFALIWNEPDGGGSQYFNKTSNIKSYVGTNDANGTGENDITVQIYSVDDTTKTGTRFNFNANGAYYVKGEKGQGNPTDREVAVKGDIATVQTELDTTNGNLALIQSQMQLLEAKIADLKQTNTELYTLYYGNDEYYENIEKDYIFEGNIDYPLTIIGRSAIVRNLNANATTIDVKTTEDIDIKNVSMDGIYDKNKLGNSMSNLHSDSFITIKDCVIDPETAYNGFEIGLTSGLAKGILINNCNFKGVFSNNAINIFGQEDDCIITISNCHFSSVSNMLRLSNRTNEKCIINIINCIIDKWETGNPAYAGPIICQDYTSTSLAEAQENNLFGNGKITINIQNLIKPDGTKVEPVSDISTVCGSGLNQLVYVYNKYEGIVPYSADRYPILNIL